MSKLIISDAITNGIQGTTIVTNEEKSEEYKKLVKEANERIRADRIREANAIIKANNYIAL